MLLASVAWGISTGMMVPGTPPRRVGSRRARFGYRVGSVACWGQMMGWLRIIGVLAVAACVAGCARNWVRPGADGAALARERFECQFEAAKAVAAGETDPENGEAKRGEFESIFMEARGWSR